MGTLLNKNHPFRASITHDENGNAAQGSDSASSSSNSNSKSKSKLPPMSAKTKLILYSVVGGIIAFGWMEIYDSIYPEAEAKTKKQRTKAETYGTNAEDDWSYPPDVRDVYQSRKSVSWLSKTFCRGGKRAQFCD